MRFNGMALCASVVLLGACGGEKKPATDSAAANAAANATTPASTTPATSPAGATTPAVGAAAGAPVTGKTYEVKMIGDANGYKFEPATLTIKQGDGIKYIMASGGPHNIAFLNVTDAAAKGQLDANMPGAKMSEMSSPMLMQPNEAYLVSFGKVPAGKYEFTCTPHAAMNMKGSVTVQ